MYHHGSNIHCITSVYIRSIILMDSGVNSDRQVKCTLQWRTITRGLERKDNTRNVKICQNIKYENWWGKHFSLPEFSCFYEFDLNIALMIRVRRFCQYNSSLDMTIKSSVIFSGDIGHQVLRYSFISIFMKNVEKCWVDVLSVIVGRQDKDSRQTCVTLHVVSCIMTSVATNTTHHHLDLGW